MLGRGSSSLVYVCVRVRCYTLLCTNSSSKKMHYAAAAAAHISLLLIMLICFFSPLLVNPKHTQEHEAVT